MDYEHDFGYDQEQYEDYEAPSNYEGYDFPSSSGVGRSSGPARHPRREQRPTPGYDQNYRRNSSSDSRQNRHRDGYNSDRNTSRDRRRGSGAHRAHQHGYGK